MKEEKRLTKIKALEICEELWMWLAKTGYAYKNNWSGWNKYHKMENDCPCCEYSYQFSAKHMPLDLCNRCPIKWTYEKEYADNNYCICERLETSPYHTWCHTETVKTRKTAAEDMLILIRKTLRHERSK